MLSKEKIDRESSKCAIGAGFYPRDIKSSEERRIGFNLGATWASEQYAEVVSALETVILEYQRKNTLTVELSIALDLAQAELNKLKQP